MTKSVTVGVHEAKTNLSKLLRLVESGAEVQIGRGSELVARLVPAEKTPPPRRLGFALAEFEVPGVAPDR